MSASHVVQDLLFDVEFETQEQAWEHQERLASFLHRTALQIIEEEFDRCSGSDAVLRLDVLSVDLGTLALDELDTLGAQRLREQLWLALQGHCEPRQGSEAYDDEPGQVEGTLWRTPADADLEAFVQFLQSGRWPWYVRFACDPVELAERVWQQRARQLLQRLRGLAESPTALCRVVRQMSPAWLRRLESSLTHRALSELLPWPANSEHAERRLRAALMASTAVTSAIEPDQMAPPWPEAQRQDPAALQRLLREVLALYLPLSDVERVLNAWQQAAPVAKSAAELGPMLASLRMLVARADGAEADDSSEVEQEASTDGFRSAVVQRLKAWLVNQADADALSAEDEAELEALWADAQRQDPAALRRLLSTLGASVPVRRHMAQHWPRRLLREVLALYLSPSDVERVLNLWQQVSQIDRSAQDALAGKSAVEQAAWGIVLRYLWAGDTEGQAAMSPMLVSLRRLAVRADDPAEVEPEAGANESRSAAVQRLKAWLASRADADALSAEDEAELEALWAGAQRQGPAALRQLLSTLGASVRVRRHIARHWPQRVLREVLALYLSPFDVESVFNAWQQAARIDPLAPDARAAKTAAEQAAWQTVLRHLWAGDAEGQAVVSPMLASLRTLAARADDPAEVEQEANADGSRSAAVQRLKAWLVSQADADAMLAGDTAELEALWADAQRQDSATLQRLLRKVLALHLSPSDVKSVLNAWREAAQSDSLAPDAPAGKSAVEQAAWGIVLRHLWAGDTEGQAVVSPMLVPLRRLAVRADDPAEVEPEADAGGLRSAAVQHLKAWLVKQADANALSAEDEAELDALWVDAQRQDPAALRRLLSTLGVAARVRRHMAQHWPQRLLREVLVLYLSPSDVERVFNLWQQVSQIERSAQDAPAGKSAVEQAAWGIVLRYLWAGDTEGQAAVSPMLVSLRRLAVRADDPAEVELEANGSRSTTVQRLKAWSVKDDDADVPSVGEDVELEGLWGDAQRQDPAVLQRLQREVLASLRTLATKADDPAAEVEQEANADGSRSAAVQRLKAWLVKQADADALSAEDEAELEALWADAQRQDPAALQRLLSTLGVSVRVRRHMAQHWPQRLLREVLALYLSPSDVESVLNAWWEAAQSDSQAPDARGSAKTAAEQAAWQTVLRHLWAGDAEGQAVASLMLASLRTLAAKADAPAEVESEANADGTRSTAVQRLKAWLVKMDTDELSAGEETELEVLLADAQRQDPAALQRLLREVLALHLSPSDVESVLNAWREAAEGQTVLGPMLASLRAPAERGDRVEFDDPAEVEPEVNADWSGSAAVQRLKAWLVKMDANKLSAEDGAELEALWADAQRQDPAALQRLLREVLALHLSPSDVESVLNAWREAAEGQTVLGPVLASLRALAERGDRVEFDDPAEVEPEANADGSRSAAVQRLKAWLVSQADADAMLTGDAAELEALWADVQRRDSAALRQLLRTLGASVRVRRYMAQHWPQRLLREMLALYLSPFDVESVFNAWQQAARIDPLAPDARGGAKTAAEQAAWHTVLRHLWARDIEGRAVAIPMLASLRTLAAKADDPAEVEQETNANGLRNAVVQAWQPTQSTALVRALRAWWPEAQVEALMRLLGGSWPLSWLRLVESLGSQAEPQRLTNQLALLVETATVPPEPVQLVAWLWRECAQRQHRSAAELALALKADRSAAAVAWLKWWPDVQAVLGDESHGDAQATLEPETAGAYHASDRHTFTVALSARLPGEQAEMLAELVFGTLPQGWQEAADGVSGEVAGCMQWCLRTLDNQPKEPPPDVAELVHRWLPVLAWQQGRSPQEWVDDVLIKSTRAADALRQQAWLKGWMEEKRTPDAQPESPSWQCSLNSPHLKHLQQVDLMRLGRNSQALQAWAAALPDGAWPEVWALLLPPPDVPVLMQALQSLNSMAFGDSSQALLALRQQALTALLWLTPADLVTVVGHLVERQAWRADVPLPMWARQLRDQAAVTEGMTSPLAQLWGHWITEPQVRREGGEKDEPIETALHRLVADLRQLESDAMAPTILADWLRLIHHSHADTVQARAILSREMEKTAAAHRLADRLTPGELLAVVAWLRPAEAKDLRAVWPQLRLLALPWPAVARPLLRDRFVEDRPFEVDALLQRMKRAVWRDSPRQGQMPASTATRAQSEPWHFPEPPDLNEPIFVTNAGLVLLGPYLPLLFDRLGLLREQRFIDERAAERAVLLTQFAVTGHAAAPETDLMLNKLLCGVPFEAVLPRAIVMQAHEQEMIETLLTAVIAHWSALGRTSVAGLRETFLQREGRLEHGEDRWQLQVKSLTFDVLMDRLPWGYATLKFPWMREVLHVDWR